MSDEIVLLIPQEGDPCNLLAGDAGGAKPPLAWRHIGTTTGRIRWYEGQGPGDAPTALILKWEGNVILPGCWIAAATLPWYLGNHMRRAYVQESFDNLLSAIRQAALGEIVKLEAAVEPA